MVAGKALINLIFMLFRETCQTTFFRCSEEGGGWRENIKVVTAKVSTLS
jgi:hypothetical protein